MNTKAVKSFGLALIVAVGVLALLLATGTFSPQKAGAQVLDEDDTTLMIDPNEPGAGARVQIELSFDSTASVDDFETMEIELEGYTIPEDIERRDVLVRSGSGTPANGLPVAVTVEGNVISLELNEDDDQDTPGIASGQSVVVVLRKSAGITAPALAGTYDVRVDDRTFENAVTVSPSLSLNPTKGGGSTEVAVSGKAFADGTGSLYSETLTNPDQNNDGIIDTLIVGDEDDDNTPNIPGVADTNDYTLDVNGDGEMDYHLFFVALVAEDTSTTPTTPAVAAHHVAVPIPATGDPVSTVDDAVELGYTISAAPAPTGDATTPVENTPTMPDPTYTGAEHLKDVMVSDGAFSTTVSAEDLEFGGSENMSYVRITDADGDDARARFQVTGTMTLGADSVGKGRLLKISLSDWIIDLPDEVKIGGVRVAMDVDDADTEDANESTWYDGDGEQMATAPTPAMLTADPAGALDFQVKVSGDVGLGTKSVVLFDGGTALAGARASVAITASELTVSPSTAVVGREVTVTGSGFTDDVAEIKVGGVAHCATVAKCAIEVASGGRVVAAFNIPDDATLAKAGDYSIMITDSSGRVGTAMVTIPERTITVDPAESRIGSTIDLSGNGWPSGSPANLVGIYYDGIQYASAVTGSDGTWSASISVPHAAGVGTTHKVEAMATVGGGDTANVMQEEDHKTPDAVVTLSSAQAERGSYVTVSGENFHTFQTVKILIVDSDVTPSGLTTDADGSFSGRILVPGLSLGNKNLKVTVNDVPVVEFLEIVDAPATPVVTSNDPADVFASLIEAGALDAVWVYNNDDGKYRGFIPGATDSEMMLAETLGIALTEVNSGDIAWINLNADATFQGTEYTAGWKLVTIN